ERTRSTTATPIRWTWATSPWGAAVRTRARSRRTALTRLRLLHRKRTTAKALIVEAGDGLLGVVVVGVFDEGKAPGPTRLAIGWEIAVGDGPDGSEVLSNFRFCRFVRKSDHTQTNWHGRSTTPLAPDGSTGPGPVPGSMPAEFHPASRRNPRRIGQWSHPILDVWRLGNRENHRQPRPGATETPPARRLLPLHNGV